MGKIINLNGMTFNRLKVIEFSHLSTNKKALWKCLCECGKETLVESYKLRTGHTKSCGCFNSERTSISNEKHGLCKNRLYSIWCGIVSRTENKKNASYKNYGERGIHLCDEWRNNFKKFYDWSMKNGYKENLSIDRINVNGNYEPLNCRWATIEEQCNNKRNTIKINGLPLTEFCKENKLNYYTIYARIKKYHWSEEKVLLVIQKERKAAI